MMAGMFPNFYLCLLKMLWTISYACLIILGVVVLISWFGDSLYPNGKFSVKSCILLAVLYVHILLWPEFLSVVLSSSLHILREVQQQSTLGFLISNDAYIELFSTFKIMAFTNIGDIAGGVFVWCSSSRYLGQID